MSSVPKALLIQLINLIEQLRADSADFLENHQDAQQWYNRGYANGMVRGLQHLLGDQMPTGLRVDDEQLLKGHEVMAWGKAYRHGESVGEKEIHEITGTL